MGSVRGRRPTNTPQTLILGDCFCLNQANVIALDYPLWLFRPQIMASIRRSILNKMDRKVAYALYRTG
jgi:hypothetical protein